MVLACAAARADTIVEHDEHGYHGGVFDWTWNDPRLSTGIGVGVNLGGGVSGFTDRAVRDTTSPVGGLWDLRATFGTHLPLAIEVAYLGSATQIQSLFGHASGTLIGTTLESDLRVNFLPHAPIDPYAFVGVGWQRYNVDEPDFNVADTGIASRDDVLEIPVGGGIAYRYRGFVTDVRGTFRATRDSRLVLDPDTRTYAPLHSWGASLSIGYEL